MKKNAILLFIFTGLCSTLQAQEEKGPAVLGTKIIRMPKFTIADFPKKSVPVSSIELFQNLEDSIVLGYVQKGIDGHIVELKTEKGLTRLLQDHINKMYKNDYKQEGAAMLWVLENLRIAERTTFSNSLAFARIKISSYMAVNKEAYRQLIAVDSVYVMESGSDVTPWHGTHIEDAFRTILQRSLKAAKNMNADEKLFSRATIIAASKPPVAASPVLSATEYKNGFYATFEEFLQNNPSISNAETIAGKKGKLYIVGTGANKTDTLQVWGLCKNGEIYKYENGALVPLEKKGNTFIISDYVEKVNRRNSNLVAASFFGGLVGAALVEKNGPPAPLVTNIPSIKKRGKYPLATCIDMTTGAFSF